MKKALEHVIEFAIFANQYVEINKPWALAKEDQKKLAEVMYVLLEMIRHIAVLLKAFIPSTAEKILGYLGLSSDTVSYQNSRQWGLLKAGQAILKVEPLFPRITE